MKPGDLLSYDFRNEKKHYNSSNGIKVLQWNIERGYKLAEIISYLKAENADIVCLQELDINCERSGSVDCLYEIAKALQMKAVMVIEFIELGRESSDVKRKWIDRVGVQDGYHGNATLSKYDILETNVIFHRYQPFNWDKGGTFIGEPRKGGRFSLVSNIDLGSETSVRVYNLHLEIFCGITGRMAQFSEVLEDCANTKDLFQHQIILGDLNTMAHGIARLSRNYCQDALRWKNLGKSEADFWDDYVFSVTSEDGPTNALLEAYYYEHVLPSMSPIPYFEAPCEFDNNNNTLTIKSPLPPLSPLNTYSAGKAFEMGRNPLQYQHELDKFFVNIRNTCDFFDPFPLNFHTLRSYMGLYSGKLDWLLVRNFRVEDRHMGNLDYSASDHRYLVGILTLDPEGRQGKRYLAAKRSLRMQSMIKQHSSYILLNFSLLSAVVLGAVLIYKYKK